MCVCVCVCECVYVCVSEREREREREEVNSCNVSALNNLLVEVKNNIHYAIIRSFP